MRFESLDMWKLAQQHYLAIDDLMKESKEYYLKDQILRASLSVSNNIAEGAERGTQQEFIRFLYIAKGSCAETRNMLYLLQQKGILSEIQFTIILKENELIGLSLKRYIDAIYKSK